MQKVGISHQIIKTIRKLKRKSINNLLVIEGLGVMEMAIKNPLEVKAFIYCDELIYSEEAILIKEKYEHIAENVYMVSKKTYISIADKDNSGGFIAIVKHNTLDIDEVDLNNYNLVLILNGLELPGNMGSIYRTCYASKVDLIINVDCITDISNPKFVTSSRGVFFDIPTVNSTYEIVQKKLLEADYRILLAEPVLGKSYHGFNYDGKVAIVVGSERFGINENWYANRNEKIFIPMCDNIKSLNVGVAASILIYEAAIKKGKV